MMLLVCRKFSWRSFRRRLPAGLALLAYLVVAVGFPVAAGPVKDHGQPFPCQYHACGCRTAEECWAHCCCFSPEERLAWARANHVEPPAYAEQPAARGWHTARLRDQEVGESGRKSCCAGHGTAKSACCKQEPAAPARERPSSDGDGLHWVSGLQSLLCRGVSTLWVSSGALLPPPPVSSWHPALPLAGSVCDREAHRLPPSFTPPDPPPRPVSA